MKARQLPLLRAELPLFHPDLDGRLAREVAWSGTGMTLVGTLLLTRERVRLRILRELSHAAAQVPALNCVRRKRQRPVVSVQRLLPPAQPPQQVGARRMEQIIGIQLAAGCGP